MENTSTIKTSVNKKGLPLIFEFYLNSLNGYVAAPSEEIIKDIIRCYGYELPLNAVESALEHGKKEDRKEALLWYRHMKETGETHISFNEFRRKTKEDVL